MLFLFVSRLCIYLSFMCSISHPQQMSPKSCSTMIVFLKWWPVGPVHRAKNKVTTRSTAMLAVPCHLKFCFRHDPSVDANGCYSPHAWECRMISLRRHLPGCVGIGCSCPPALPACFSGCGRWAGVLRQLPGHVGLGRFRKGRCTSSRFVKSHADVALFRFISSMARSMSTRRRSAFCGANTGWLGSDTRRQSHARFQILPISLDKRTRPVPLRPTPGQ